MDHQGREVGVETRFDVSVTASGTCRPLAFSVIWRRYMRARPKEGGMRRRNVAIILVAIAASLAIGFVYLTGDTQGYPRKLGSMTLTRFTSGASALSELTIMHSMSPEVKMVDAFIVDYTGKGDASAIVYVSIAEDEEQAQDLLDLMNEKIDPGDGYTYTREMRLPGDDHPAVYYTEGHGAHHYLWAEGDKVYWIAVQGLSQSMRLDFLDESLRALP